jgi:hypothetical protein
MKLLPNCQRCDSQCEATGPCCNWRPACCECPASSEPAQPSRAEPPPRLLLNILGARRPSTCRSLVAHGVMAVYTILSAYVVRFWPVAVAVSGGYLVLRGFLARRQARQRPMTVLITGAGGHIGYSLTTLIAQGLMFGPTTPVYLHLLDVKQVMVPLEGLRLELQDLASPLLRGGLGRRSA